MLKGSWDVEEDDIVLAASDGFFDNFLKGSCIVPSNRSVSEHEQLFSKALQDKFDDVLRNAPAKGPNDTHVQFMMRLFDKMARKAMDQKAKVDMWPQSGKVDGHVDDYTLVLARVSMTEPAKDNKLRAPDQMYLRFSGSKAGERGYVSRQQKKEDFVRGLREEEGARFQGTFTVEPTGDFHTSICQ